MKKKTLTITDKAFKALKEAVKQVVVEHRRTGLPLIVWKNGKVVKIPANRI